MRLVRVSDTGTETLGVLLKDKIPFCMTLEDSWRDNKTGISCIPAGKYVCTLVTSPSHGQVYQVMDVPGRTHILIHGGNTDVDTEGCILLGSSFGKLAGKNAVLNSRVTLRDFMYRMGGAPHFDLEIINADTQS